jgi:hypothetical protein
MKMFEENNYHNPLGIHIENKYLNFQENKPLCQEKKIQLNIYYLKIC